MFPFPGGQGRRAEANFICSLINLWNGKRVSTFLPVFEALLSGPWQLAHNKFPRHNLNVISGLRLGHEYLRCKLFGSVSNLLWILFDEKNESLLLIKFAFLHIINKPSQVNQTALPERIGATCLGDNIRLCSTPSMLYLWFKTQRTGRIFVLGQSVLASKSIWHAKSRHGGVRGGSEIK